MFFVHQRNVTSQKTLISNLISSMTEFLKNYLHLSVTWTEKIDEGVTSTTVKTSETSRTTMKSN